MRTFEEFSAMNAHQQEIASSRVGCLGSSDAAMVLKVARKGINALSNTDIKRLRVMLGLEQQNDFGGNAYTNAGHRFEEYMGEVVSGIRELRFETSLLKHKHFKIIAHADFAIQSGLEIVQVVECKFVQKPTVNVLQQYMPQLQWYYLFNVPMVKLAHGQGTAEPFMVQKIESVDVPHDHNYTQLLLHGLQMIDEWCDEYLAGQHE